MAIKSIVALADGEDLHSVFSTAMALTARLSSRLDVLHIKANPNEMIPIGAEGMTAEMVDDFLNAAKVMIEERRTWAKAEYDRTCASANKSAHWIEVVGRPSKVLSIASRFTDLLVLARPEKKSAGTLLEAVDTAMFETGRPLVLVPARLSSVIGNRIMIAWNGSTQAAVAVTAALPLLHQAQVDIVQIGDIGEDAPASDLAIYLSLHGIHAQIHTVDLGSRAIDSALIDAAGRFNSDLIVMGAYGHSRLRERILGGATRSLLANSMLPLFMMH